MMQRDWGMTLISERGGIPPSELTERGQFTARFYRDVVSVSIPYLTIDERKAAIARLPRALPGADATAAVATLSTLFSAISVRNGVRPTYPSPVTPRKHPSAGCPS